jgi:hypothetical protein
MRTFKNGRSAVLKDNLAWNYEVSCSVDDLGSVDESQAHLVHSLASHLGTSGTCFRKASLMPHFLRSTAPRIPHHSVFVQLGACGGICP